MRLIFTSYAINSAAVSLILTLALMMYDELSERFIAVVNCVLSYMQILFGPVLLTFCGYGFSNIRNLANKCKIGENGHEMNTFDLGILFLACLLSVMVTCSYGLKLTIKFAEKEINREGSVFFAVFMG